MENQMTELVCKRHSSAVVIAPCQKIYAVADSYNRWVKFSVCFCAADCEYFIIGTND